MPASQRLVTAIPALGAAPDNEDRVILLDVSDSLLKYRDYSDLKTDLSVAINNLAWDAAAFGYAFSTTTTEADPTSGILRLNHATPASATKIFIDDEDENAIDIQAFLRTLDDSTSTVKGFIKLQKKSAGGTFRLYSVSGLTEETGYFDIDVTHVAGDGSFAASDDLAISFVPKGDKGDTGATGATGTVEAAGDGTVSAPGISFSADTNTGFYRPGADQIGVAVGGAQVGLWTSTGLNNAVIGATTPAAITGTTGTYSGLVAVTVATGYAATFMGGNVGIGTTEPGQKFVIAAPSDSLASSIIGRSTGQNEGWFRFYQNNETTLQGGIYGSNNVGLTLSGPSATADLNIINNGNVGIGTTEPTTKLGVAGGVQISGTGSPTTGVGLEIVGGATPYIQAYNRDTTAYLPLNVYGSTFAFNPGVSGVFHITNEGSVGFNTTDQFGSGVKVLAIANAGTVPSTNPTGGGVLYAEAGAGKWRGSSGTITTFGTAEPHCPSCGADYMAEWESEKYGYFSMCLKCLADEMGDRDYIVRKKAA